MPENPKLAVVGATLIDGTGRPPLTPVTVIIEADRVAGVGPAATTPVPAGTEAEIDALADAGVDGIKLYVTVRADTARRACARAHARGLPVFMHQHATRGAEAALAGVDSVEHVNVFGQLAPAGFWLAEPAKLNPFEYGGWLWRWLGDLDP